MIYNRELRIKCRELMKQNDSRLSTLLLDIFSDGIKKKEIRDYDIEGMIFLYLTMAQGVLDAVLIHKIFHLLGIMPRRSEAGWRIDFHNV